MDIKEIIKLLESKPDLATNEQRLSDYIEMGRNVFLEANDFEEGKRICIAGRDMAIEASRKSYSKDWYMLYLTSLKYLCSYFQDFESYLLYVDHKRDPKEQYYLPRQKQFRPIAKALQKMIDDELDLLTISVAPGTGKALLNNAGVLTPNGWTTIGEIAIGDEVFSGTGNRCRVDGVFPQGKKPIYRMTFNDGSHIDSSCDHIWQIVRRGRTKNLITSEIRPGDRIMCVPHIEFNERPLMLHPYIVGVLLGDGSITQSSVRIANPDEEIISLVDRFLPAGYKTRKRAEGQYDITREVVLDVFDRNGIKTALSSYGLIGTHADTKFIPDDYLYNTYQNRKWLLRGLLDTDGSAKNKNNAIEYVTVSERLKDGVVELVRGMGGRASFSKHPGFRVADGVRKPTKDYYKIYITLPKGDKDVFMLPRKANRYNPTKERLHKTIKTVEYIGEEECTCIHVDDPSHLFITDNYTITHNTTMQEFFLSYVMGLWPEKCNLSSSFSSDITGMFHKAVLNIIQNKGDYAWSDVFPSVNLEAKSDKEQWINLGKFKPFKTLTCRSIDATLTGATRYEGFLVCDDLVRDIEEALNPSRLETLYMKYMANLRTRGKHGAKEIHIATRWSVHDVIGRLIAGNTNNSRAEFIAIPCYNEKGESNFDFKYGVGFSTEDFKTIENQMDEISFRCLYLSDPIEREGLLYHKDELKRYSNLPVDDEGNTIEPDAIIAVCDTKDIGTDYNCLLVAYQYDDRFYLEDLVYNNSSPYVLDELNARCLVKNRVQKCQFESNKEGSRTANEVQKRVDELKGRCRITKKYTTSNKETKIIVNADWVKDHVYFKDDSLFERRSEYGQFLNDVCSYVQMAKNKHDDAVDALAMLAIFIESMQGGVVTILSRSALGI